MSRIVLAIEADYTLYPSPRNRVNYIMEILSKRAGRHMWFAQASWVVDTVGAARWVAERLTTMGIDNTMRVIRLSDGPHGPVEWDCGSDYGPSAKTAQAIRERMAQHGVCVQGCETN